MILDFSKLSSMQRYKLGVAIRNAAYKEMVDLENDLSYYPDKTTETYLEMQGWLNAIKEIHLKAAELTKN